MVAATRMKSLLILFLQLWPQDTSCLMATFCATGFGACTHHPTIIAAQLVRSCRKLQTRYRYLRDIILRKRFVPASARCCSRAVNNGQCPPWTHPGHTLDLRLFFLILQNSGANSLTAATRCMEKSHEKSV